MNLVENYSLTGFQKMIFKFLIIFGLLINFQIAATTVGNRTNDFFEFIISQPNPNEQSFQSSNKCTSRLYTSLEKLRKRQPHFKSTAFIDLTGYALHQSLRNLPLDMYVTDIRVRTPGIGDWVRIKKCQFSNIDNKMSAQILFNDLTVSGTVRLLDDAEKLKYIFNSTPKEFCKMSLRIEKAGLGINAFPMRGKSRGIDVVTEARFLDPQFLSIHAYGCKFTDVFKREEQVNIKRVQGTSLGNEDFNSNFFRNDFMELEKQHKLPRGSNSYSRANLPKNLIAENSSSFSTKEIQPEVRIITLHRDSGSDDPQQWSVFQENNDTDLQEFHRSKIIASRFHQPTEKEKLKAVLYIQKLIAEQANQVFQTQGPFSQIQKPLFRPSIPLKSNAGVLSIITELDENLSPVRPVQQKPFETLFSSNHKPDSHPNHSHFQTYYEEVSKEMEDVFLRGIKTLLTSYVKKQLEIPLKEALMVNFGFTISYG